MIIVRTANGCEFINDEDVTRITHNKKVAEVCIYRGALPCTITQVVSVTYTTKKDAEYEDPCEYVHELQHALRMCGITKEIDL